MSDSMNVTYTHASVTKSPSAGSGQVATYTCDLLNRLLSRSTRGELTVSFTYTSTGKYATSSDASGTTTYTYDSMDRLSAKATPQGTLSYTYDQAGHVASIASSNVNGASMSYTYDSLNRLATVTDSRTNGVTSYSYDPASNLATVTYPNGVQTALSYDLLNRVSALAASSNAAEISGYSYQRGPTGNLTGVLELSGRSASWTYDNTFKLTGETITSDPAKVNGSVNYQLDPVGNRLNESSSISGLSSGNWTFNADDELANETYDLNGNVTATGGKTFAYNSQNQLVSMNGAAEQLVYDAFGNRVSKIANGAVTTYLVEDDANPTGYPQVFDELTNGVVSRTYAYGLQRISQEQLVKGAWTTSYYGYDGGGSVRNLTNTSGTVTDTYVYDAFGNALKTSGSTPNVYLYRGEQYDPDLGLYYLRARYYNPITGRLISHDPRETILYDQVTLNRYQYSASNPVNDSDPTGREVLFQYAFKASKSISAGAIVVNTLACGVNIGLAVANDEFLNVLAGSQGGIGAGIGWGGLGSATYGCLTVAWRPTGALVRLNNAMGVLGCGIGLAQTVYDLNEYTENPTESNEKTFLMDWTGGVFGCSAGLVALYL